MKTVLSSLLATALLTTLAYSVILRVPSQYLTIQAGIDASVNGDTVLVADGTYAGAGNKNLDFGGRAIVLISENGPAFCIIDCDTSGRGFYFHSGEDSASMVVGLTITRGKIPDNGGCIKIINSSPAFKYCIFSNNISQGYYGGGAYITNGSPSFLRCTFYGNIANAFGGAIYADNSNTTVNTCILSGNLGVGCGANISGIYCSSGNPTIIYNDFFNQYVNISGAGIPTGVGVISQVNINGDSCDIYYNIFLNPRLVSPYTGDLNLREDSPCIDAGDPDSPLDPDTTFADIGALYYFQSPVFIELIVHNPNIIIPRTGGSFSFDAILASNYHQPYTIDVWTEAILPNGNIFGPILSRYDITVNPGSTIYRTLTQYVPGFAPSGFYHYCAKVGFYPDSIVDSDEIPFLKLPGEGFDSHQSGWSVSGWDDDEKSPATNRQPEIANLAVSPNPFNPSTVISFELRDASLVKLKIYDIKGREVSRPADGFYPAGAHQAIWDASMMAGGVYFARLEAGDLVQTRKMLLIK